MYLAKETGLAQRTGVAESDSARESCLSADFSEHVDQLRKEKVPMRSALTAMARSTDLKEVLFTEG